MKPHNGFSSQPIDLRDWKSWPPASPISRVVFWAFNAMLAFLEIRVPIIYLTGFNLAFSTYAFVDVVSDAIVVKRGRRLRRVGSFSNFQWMMLSKIVSRETRKKETGEVGF